MNSYNIQLKHDKVIENFAFKILYCDEYLKYLFEISVSGFLNEHHGSLYGF